MRYLLVLFLGLVAGAVIAAAALLFNPLTKGNSLSPIAVSEDELMTLQYSAVATDALLYTNDGESRVHPHPPKVLQLWERPISRTDVLVTTLSDSRGNTVGIGIKFMSDSEATRVLKGEAIVDSAWHVYLPERGSLFIEQNENYWGFLRDVVMPAYWSSADSWKGTWLGNTTTGPNAVGTARVVGGLGEFSSMQSEAVESLAARAFSVDAGPVAMQGTLTIELDSSVVVDATSR